jgi:hypothetical protein
LREHEYPSVPDAEATRKFTAFVSSLPPALPVPLAVPGLSAHGQSRAIDFQVRRGNQTIAGPQIASVRSVWEAQGWAAKLHRAVDTQQGVFNGPLLSPNEPWHYQYVR